VRFAKVGRYLRLLNNGEWSNGWRVEETFGVATEEAILNTQHSERNTRKHSDV